MKINTRSLTLAATLSALCCITGFLPYVFFLPVMVAATTLSVGMAAFVGLAFGVISIAYSFLMPTSLVAAAFIQAPYIALFPRIAAALGAFGVYAFIKRVCKPTEKTGRFAAISVSAAIGSLLNTALVVTLFVLIMPDASTGGITMLAYVPSMLISGTIECVCMAVITPPISMTLDRVVFKRRSRRAASEPITADGKFTDKTL